MHRQSPRKEVEETYSRSWGYFKSRISINLVHVVHCCIRGGKVMDFRIIVQRPCWEDGAGIHLFR